MALGKVASEQTKTRTARWAPDVLSLQVIHFLLLIQATVLAPQAGWGLPAIWPLAMLVPVTTETPTQVRLGFG